MLANAGTRRALGGLARLDIDTREAVTVALLQAAASLVTGAGCEADGLNPCYHGHLGDPGWDGHHWGGGLACGVCYATWALSVIRPLARAEADR